MKKIAVIFALVLTINLSAQTITSISHEKNKVYFLAGIDPASLITIGYQRCFDKAVFNRFIISYTEISSSIFSVGSDNSEIKIGCVIPVFSKNKFLITNNLNVSAGKVKTKNFNSTEFTIGDEIRTGWFGKKSFISMIAGYEHILLNYIKNSDHYREVYYNEAKDGLYNGGGGAFQFGVSAGLTIMSKIDTYLELKVPFTEKFNGYGGSPFHARLGIAYRF